tara:strand:- start:74 stop:217 length:144 start_codon:yes stop_codon:yes gene_type:complete
MDMFLENRAKEARAETQETRQNVEFSMAVQCKLYTENILLDTTTFEL